MVRRTYGEENRNPVEQSISDRKVIERFIAQIEDDKEVSRAQRLLQSSDSVEATATYQLDHPYEGENFWKYSLPQNEEVSAQVNLQVEIDDQEMQYEGRIHAGAYDIFHPADHIDGPNSTQIEEESDSAAQKEASTPAAAQTD